MELFRKKIVDYFSDIINQIDIQSEKVLENSEQEKKIEIEKIRNSMILKVKECQETNLGNLSAVTQMAFEKIFCFFIPNFRMEVNKYDKHEEYSCLKFNNEIGNLIILNIYLNKNIITYLNQTINNNYDDDFPNLETYEDQICSTIILDLLNLRANLLPIVDLTDISKSVLEELKLIDNGKDLELKEIEFLPKIISIDLSKRIFLRTSRLEFLNVNVLKFFNYLNHLIVKFIEPINLDKSIFDGLINLKNLQIIGVNKINNESFKGLNELENLDLNRNHIVELDADNFKSLSSLKSLNLSENHFKIIRKETFKYLTNLVALNISTNDLDVIEEKAFSGLDNLKQLILHHKKDSQMSYQELKIHQAAFESCTNLEILDLSYFQTVNLESLNILTKLKYLCLYKNYLCEVSVLKNFENMEVLNLEGNLLELKCIDSLVLPNLRYLSFDCKFISKFGRNFKNLQALKINYVNFMDEDSFENLENLEYLKIHPGKWPFNYENTKFKKLENLRIILFKFRRKSLNFNINLDQVVKLFFSNQINIAPQSTNSNYFIVYRDDECKSGKDFLKLLKVSESVKKEIENYF